MSDPNERPIVIRRVKRGGHGGHHGGSWKVAYADFVTAMMAFFMLLWLISTPDKAKLKGLAEYFTPNPSSPARPMGAAGTQKSQSGAGNSQSRNSSTTASQKRSGSNTQVRMIATDIKTAIVTSPQLNSGPSNLLLEPTPDGMRINLMDTATRTMFKGNTAILNEYAEQLLAVVSRKIIRSKVKISIEGHTLPTTSEGAGNWSLSSKRAQAAMQAMNDNGIASDRFVEVIALAGTRPIYPDQPTRPENKRVTVVLLNEPGALPGDASFKF